MDKRFVEEKIILGVQSIDRRGEIGRVLNEEADFGTFGHLDVLNAVGAVDENGVRRRRGNGLKSGVSVIPCDTTGAAVATVKIRPFWSVRGGRAWRVVTVKRVKETKLTVLKVGGVVREVTNVSEHDGLRRNTDFVETLPSQGGLSGARNGRCDPDTTVIAIAVRNPGIDRGVVSLNVFINGGATKHTPIESILAPECDLGLERYTALEPPSDKAIGVALKSENSFVVCRIEKTCLSNRA